MFASCSQHVCRIRYTHVLILLSLVLVYAATADGQTLSDGILSKYLSNEQLGAWGDEYAHRCGHIARKFSLGKSVGGVELWGLEISDKPGIAEPEPNFKYVANMHGNEPSGRVLLPAFANWLCDNYKTDERVRRLVQDTHLYIIPTMNPDGFAARTRENKAGVDLNRNFPDPIKQAGSDLNKPLPNAAPEVLAIMSWSSGIRFAASANLHEGAIVANYPFDGHPDGGEDLKPVNNPTPDDATFRHLSKTYANGHAFMSQSKEFRDGITNGAHWYPVYGGMQDWNYVARSCFGITLELSEEKWRPEADLAKLWEENKEALVQLPLTAALGGIRGWVQSANQNALAATIVIDGIAPNTSCDAKFGFYARPLAPGKYQVSAVAPGHVQQQQQVEVPDTGQGVVLNFTLQHIEAAAFSHLAATLSGNVTPSPNASLLELGADSSFQGVKLMYVMGVVVCLAGLAAALSLLRHGLLRGPAWQPVPAHANGVRPPGLV